MTLSTKARGQFAEICRRLAEGETSLRQICRDRDMPAKSTVLAWIAEDEALRAAYEAAREDGFDVRAQRIIELSAAAANATYTDERGNVRVDSGAVQAAKLLADNEKWVLARQAWKQYGDRLTTEHTGGDRPMTLRIVSGVPRDGD